jgi:hypothetical protein
MGNETFFLQRIGYQAKMTHGVERATMLGLLEIQAGIIRHA